VIAEGQDAKVNQPVAIFSEDKTENISSYALPEEKPPEVEEVTEEVVVEEKKVQAAFAQPVFKPEPPLEDYQFHYAREMVDKRIKASPLAKKLAKEKGLDLTTVKGTGPGGRIVEADLARAQKGGSVVFGSRAVPSTTPGTYEEQPLTPMRKIIAERLQQAKSFIPHFYVEQVIDAMPLFQCREELLAGNIKLSFNDFVMRATALALRDHPTLNSAFNTETNTICHFSTIDISLAVSLEAGLITPIIRHADFKNLAELSQEVKTLVKKAREGHLEPHEYKGGSFTISNMGMFGIDRFSAIINPPQAAILAVGALIDQPVIKNHAVVPGKTLSLTLSVDHRVVDGVAAAKFLNSLKHLLEHPSLLLL
ncbi:MAG: 2-oxo acid dehydrogenase subunit E2, partial [Chlamydiia bacterium]|nr:2-oxo acid dehydrogenase subunit E2 [Chlamydiia bacterium]